MLRGILIIPCVLSLLLICGMACEDNGQETLRIDAGVVNINCTSEDNFPISDEDTPGWKQNEGGAATLTLYFVIEDIGDTGAAVSSIDWTLYDAKGNYVTSESYFIGKKIDKGGSTEAEILITLRESHANQIDDADGAADDFSGSGTFEFTLQGRDSEYGALLNYVPDFAPMTVSLPEM